MRLAVLKERRAGEARVAVTPDTVKKLAALGLSVAVETGAGVASAVSDEDYVAAGAEIAVDAAAALNGAGILFAVNAPDADVRALIAPGTLLIATLGASSDATLAPALAEAKIDSVGLELLPRITRAQSMDVLSSGLQG